MVEVDLDRPAPRRAPARRARCARARPTGRRRPRAARAGCAAPAAPRSPARAPPRTGRRSRCCRCRSPTARRRRGRPAPGTRRRRGCPRWSGSWRRSRPRPASSATSRSDTWMAWTTVVVSERNAGALEQLDRRAAVLGLALLELARLLGGVDVADEPLGSGVGGDLAQPALRHRAHAVGRDADRHARPLRRPRPQRIHAREEGTRVGIAEARVAAAGIRGGEEDDAQASVERRLGHCDRDRVGVVVDVVELADGAVAGGRHLPADARRRRRASSRGPARSARAYIASRQLQKSSSGRSERSPTPRRSRWKACEWTFAIAGITRAPRRRRAARWRRRRHPRARRPRPARG